MAHRNVERKDLDNQAFISLRQKSELISGHLTKRLNEHLKVLRPLFFPKKILGAYLKTASMTDVHGANVAFTELKNEFEMFAAPTFGINGRLKSPLPPMDSQLMAVPYQYNLKGQEGSPSTKIISPVKWVISYACDCNIETLTGVASGREKRQESFIQESLIAHLVFVIFIRKFTALRKLITDLRYEIEIETNDELGGLPLVVLTTPIETFLPTDEFITQISQLSGVPVFNEMIDPESLEFLVDPFRDSLLAL